MNIRERRRQEAEKSLQRALERRDELLSQLLRVERFVRAVRASKNRLEKALASPQGKLVLDIQDRHLPPALRQAAPVVSPVPVSVAQGELLPPVEPVAASAFDDEIPSFLKRAAAAERDAQALVEIAADKEARAKAKREAKDIVKTKKLGPDAKRMPLTGKAALAAIRGR